MHRAVREFSTLGGAGRRLRAAGSGRRLGHDRAAVPAPARGTRSRSRTSVSGRGGSRARSAAPGDSRARSRSADRVDPRALHGGSMSAGIAPGSRRDRPRQHADRARIGRAAGPTAAEPVHDARAAPPAVPRLAAVRGAADAARVAAAPRHRAGDPARGAQLRCEYEWRHHERLAQAAGLSRGRGDRVRDGAAPTAGPSARRAAARGRRAARAARALRRAVGRAARHFTEPELIELCMLVGHYEMLAMTINWLRIEPDTVAARRVRGALWPAGGS